MTLSEKVSTTDVGSMRGTLDEYTRSTRDRHNTFLQSISNREVRKHFASKLESDLTDFRLRGVHLQIGAIERQKANDTSTIIGNAYNSIRMDHSNDNLNKQRKWVREAIDRSGLSIEEKQKLLFGAYKSLSLAQYHEVWKAGDPISDMIFDVKGGESTPIKDPLSAGELADNAGERTVEPRTDLGSIKTGIDGFDMLSLQDKLAVAKEYAAKSTARTRKERASIAPKVKELDKKRNEGVIPGVSLDELSKAYSPEQASQIWERFNLKKQLASTIARLPTMTSEEAAEFFDQFHTEIASMPAEQQFAFTSLYNDLFKKRGKFMEALYKDPVSWGLKHKQIDPIRFDNPEALGETFAKRASFVKALKRDFKVESKLFSAEEEKLLHNQLMKSSSSDFLSLFKTAWEGTHEVDRDAVFTSLSRIEDVEVASVATLSVEGSSEANTVAQRIAVGAKRSVDAEKLYKASPNALNQAFDTKFDPLIAKQEICVPMPKERPLIRNQKRLSFIFKGK